MGGGGVFSTSGIQEFVEAASFLHYIRHRSLISLEEINARLVFMRTGEPDPKVSGSVSKHTHTHTPMSSNSIHLKHIWMFLQKR